MSRVGVFGIVGVMALSAALFYFTSSTPVILPPVGASTQEDGIAVSDASAVVGMWECLPQASSASPQTAECAVGLAKDGSSTHYGLDLAAVPDAAIHFTSGAHVRIEGTVVPAEAFNTTAWHKYKMAGIVHVTNVTKI